MTPIQIPLSKQKLILMTIGAFAFVGIGLWFVIAPPVVQNSYWGNPTRIMVAGYLAIAFFGLVAVFLIRKLPDTKPGLIIDDTGILDNSSGLAAGQILWSDIENISVIEISKQRLIMIHVKNPEHYIDRQPSAFKRRLMKMNHNMYGTPISITANGLKIGFDELMKVLTERMGK
jgi:hypothetical protein